MVFASNIRMIVVIDYNVGNVKSVCNAFRHISCQVELSRDADIIRKATGVVLPGVAAFGYAVNALGSVAEVIKETALEGKPLLGICVGFQMLFQTSSEYGLHDGLGLISGNVVPIPKGRVIPHMGWNLVKFTDSMDLFADLGSEKHFYFAHSYCAEPKDNRAKIAYTEYGVDLVASVQKANIYGTQFHPEKSGPAGLKVLQNFYDICKRAS
ncbi:MAG: imidazole glycerol phosphate synthase subunit HisH [Sedimentisphaerales bacterium]|jgi:glutamine amidotransferase